LLQQQTKQMNNNSIFEMRMGLIVVIMFIERKEFERMRLPADKKIVSLCLQQQQQKCIY
jgi:hypothetical protein